MTTTRLHISVIIPALNEGQSIAACVQSVLKAQPDEIIVVDGGSRDDTREIADANGARVVSAARGRALQQNAGAAIACGDVLLFLHADCKLGTNAIQQIRHALASDRIVFGSFRQKIDSSGLGYRLLEFGNDLRARVLRLPYGDQGIFVRREQFEKLGGFPEYRLMEDLIFSDRLRRTQQFAHLQGPIVVSPSTLEKVWISPPDNLQSGIRDRLAFRRPSR